MISLDLLKTKSGLEQKVTELKLWLVQKEDVEYTNFIQNPENAAQVKSAKDKIVSQLKLQDEEWLNKEQDLSSFELDLKVLNARYDILRDTLKCVSNPNSGVDINYFLTFQEQFIKDLGL